MAFTIRYERQPRQARNRERARPGNEYGQRRSRSGVAAAFALGAVAALGGPVFDAEVTQWLVKGPWDLLWAYPLSIGSWLAAYGAYRHIETSRTPTEQFQEQMHHMQSEYRGVGGQLEKRVAAVEEAVRGMEPKYLAVINQLREAISGRLGAAEAREAARPAAETPPASEGTGTPPTRT